LAVPCGVSMVFMDGDKHGLSALPSDPPGHYGEWKVACTGNSWIAAVSMLKQEYTEDETSLQDALVLRNKVLSRPWS